MTELIPALIRLKGIMTGIIIGKTASTGIPKNIGVMAMFHNAMVIVIVTVPNAKPMIAPFLVLFLL